MLRTIRLLPALALLFVAAQGLSEPVAVSRKAIASSPPLESTIAGFPACTSGLEGARRIATDGATSSDCTVGGLADRHECTCRAGAWTGPSAPGPHAATHKNGGGDEVATATPGANEIPKAEADGKLHPAWIDGMDADGDLTLEVSTSPTQVVLNAAGGTGELAVSAGAVNVIGTLGATSTISGVGLSATGAKVTNVGAATAASDAVRLDQVQQTGWVYAEDFYTGSSTCGLNEALATQPDDDGVHVYAGHSDDCSAITDTVDLSPTGTVAQGKVIQGVGAGNAQTSNPGTLLKWTGTSPTATGLTITITPSGTQTATFTRTVGDFAVDGVTAGMWIAFSLGDTPAFTDPDANLPLEVLSVSGATVTVSDPGNLLSSETGVTGVMYNASKPVVKMFGAYQSGLRDLAIDLNGSAAVGVLFIADNGASKVQALDFVEGSNVRNGPTNVAARGLYVVGRNATDPTNDQAGSDLTLRDSQFKDVNVALNAKQAVNVVFDHTYVGAKNGAAVDVIRGWPFFVGLDCQGLNAAQTACVMIRATAGEVHSTAHNFELQAGAGFLTEASYDRSLSLVGGRITAKGTAGQDCISYQGTGGLTLVGQRIEADVAKSCDILAPNASSFSESGTTYYRTGVGPDPTVLATRTTPNLGTVSTTSSVCTDNELARSDGTGGDTVQCGSGVTADDLGNVVIPDTGSLTVTCDPSTQECSQKFDEETSPPSDPGVGLARMVFRSAGLLQVFSNALGKVLTFRASDDYEVSWKGPGVNDDIYVKVSDGPITPTALDCVATGATTPSAFVVTIDECTVNGATCASTGGTVTLGALTTNVQDATFTDTSIADDAYVRFDVTSLTTAPDYAHCRLEFVR